MKEYENRQSEIDRLLTPQVLPQLMVENGDVIGRGLYKSDKHRHVIVVFASTAALLRYLRGDKREKPISIEVQSLAAGREQMPTSDVLKGCDPRTTFCVTVATSLPFAVLAVGVEDKIMTHTTTCLRLPN